MFWYFCIIYLFIASSNGSKSNGIFYSKTVIFTKNQCNLNPRFWKLFFYFQRSLGAGPIRNSEQDRFHVSEIYRNFSALKGSLLPLNFGRKKLLISEIQWFQRLLIGRDGSQLKQVLQKILILYKKSVHFFRIFF